MATLHPCFLARCVRGIARALRQHVRTESDFGLARIKAQLMTGNLGTCQYMAPGTPPD